MLYAENMKTSERILILLTASATLFSNVSDAIDMLNECAFVSTRYYCPITCIVDNFDETNQYVALQKTVTYYHYDIESSYGPFDLYTTQSGFAEEILETNRYFASNSTEDLKANFTMRIAGTEVGDSGQYKCQLRRKLNNEVLQESHTDNVRVVYSLDAPQIELQFGLRQDGTSDNNLIIEKLFEDKEKVFLSQRDYDNLVYIVNVTKLVHIWPPVTKIEVTTNDGETRHVNFTRKYHHITGTDEKFIPYHPIDVVYLYQPETACEGNMNIQGQFNAWTNGNIDLERELNVQCENSALKFSTSMPLMCAVLLYFSLI